MQVLKQFYIASPPEGAARLAVPWVTQVTLAVLALGVAWLGCFPGWLVGLIERALSGSVH